MPKKKKKKNGKKTNGNVGGKADVHLSSVMVKEIKVYLVTMLFLLLK